ncbi:MAG: ABC transporter ATP-binding protein [Dysgonomonas sp.]
MMKEAIISAHGLSIGYPKDKTRQSLYDGLSFNLLSGELTCLLGANGAGKSTLLRTISRMQPALSGEIQIGSQNLKEYSEQELSQTLGLVLTDKISAGGFTVRELVSLGRYPYTGFWGNLTSNDMSIVDRAMADVCILHKANAYIAELSDGERQKVMIAKALAQQCPIILLDEPTAYLDVPSRIEIMNLLHSLVEKQGIAVLLSTHDIEAALMLADRLWLLSSKTGLSCGMTEDIIVSGKITSFFEQSNISFDRETGRFRPTSQMQKKAHIMGEKEYSYWAENFLSRNNYATVPPEMNADIDLILKSGNDMLLRSNNEEFRVSSFESLADLLKQI